MRKTRKMRAKSVRSYHSHQVLYMVLTIHVNFGSGMVLFSLPKNTFRKNLLGFAVILEKFKSSCDFIDIIIFTKNTKDSDGPTGHLGDASILD